MSEESVPQQGEGTGRPKGLLQQMEELMAALNADLSDLESRAYFRREPEEAPHEDHPTAATGSDLHAQEQ